MKILRTYKIISALLSIMLSLTLLMPAQAMMLWCSMDMADSHSAMQMHQDMDMTSVHELADAHMSSMVKHAETNSGTHCDNSAMPINEHTSDENNEICSISVDCNCLITQQKDFPETSVLPTPVVLHIALNEALVDGNLFEHQNETFPPPLWNSSSYSPPQLFLANESFLI